MLQSASVARSLTMRVSQMPNHYVQHGYPYVQYGGGAPVGQPAEVDETMTPEDRERESVRAFIKQKLGGFQPQRPCK